ncbi:transposase [Flavobacterium sp. I3-2]|uniref:transposase n=1 Tax=Flavobacterium sp. I3-2 TaxID=2748319 RepID=UPI0015AF8AA2|nr:transposase [Flavobacterium sp. I3-2]
MKLEILQNECLYHIYNRGIDGCNIFKHDENKQYFLNKIKTHLEDTIEIYAYCLMDNHFHFLIKILNEDKVVQKLSNVFNGYAKALNKQENRTGSLFEKHFKRIKLENEIYLKNLIIYIHRNPKHHLDLNFEDYRFSSYQAFLSEKKTKLERAKVIELFSDKANFINSHKITSDILTENYTLE